MNDFLWDALGVNEQDGRDYLAELVKSSRRRKFPTVEAARLEAGISRGAWDGVEKARSAKDFTLAAIERALEWPEGRAQRVLDGEEVRSPAAKALGLVQPAPAEKFFLDRYLDQVLDRVDAVEARLAEVERRLFPAAADDDPADLEIEDEQDQTNET